MPIPPDVVRVRLVFDLRVGATVLDQAVMGFHVRRRHVVSNTVDWQASVDEIATKVFEKWMAHATVTARWPSMVHLSMVEAYHLDQNTGKTLHKGVQFEDAEHVWSGSASESPLPLDVSCAVSLYGYDPAAFVPDAKRKRGRFYLPPFTVGVMAGGTRAGFFTDAAVADVQGMMADFLNDVHEMTVGGGSTPDAMLVGVLSRTGNLFTPLVQLRVGHRPDSQARRGQQLDETFVQSAIATEGGLVFPPIPF